MIRLVFRPSGSSYLGRKGLPRSGPLGPMDLGCCGAKEWPPRASSQIFLPTRIKWEIVLFDRLPNVNPGAEATRHRSHTIRLIHETIQSSNCWRRGCRPSQWVFCRAHLCREHAQPSGASPSRRWLTLKSRYQNTRAKVKTTARARAVARILVKTRAKEREAAQPTEASRSSNQTLAAHIGGCLGRFREGGMASVLSQ